MIDRLATGDILGSVLDDRYTVHELIGRGGMASVYRAWDAELHRSVAIKVLRGEADSGPDARRRVREARAAAAINHPALVTLYDAVIRDDRSYLVMELIDGATLRAQIASGRLDSRDVAAIAHDLADGLHAVHAGGVIHRDIKPANILLARTTLPERPFRAKLSDFGIAHVVDATRVTSPGLFLGTASYVSPEQARGEEAAAPADIYALGLTLLEALTGTPAFVGSPLEVMTARLVRDPSVPAWLGSEWSALLTRMTDRDPSARPTAIEVAAAARAIPAADRHPGDLSVSTGALEMGTQEMSTQEMSTREMSTVALSADELSTAATSPTISTENRATRNSATANSATANSATETAATEPFDDGHPTLLLPTTPTPPGADDRSTDLDDLAMATADRQAETAGGPTETERSPRTRRRLTWTLAVTLVALTLIAVSLLTLPRPAAGESTELQPSPSLPSLAPPLDDDLRDLLEQVSP
ncbi:serine/threonine-protein kinase [Amnibacterium flavum]|uniref:non-specific serine/threonine protein kinase n=1 Tax=Amnibacterium flavum TaxID=2173173 RepID=A0A2V1HU18_9MICO|nr:serine/threonine-protein kinase [Amnibacterium flavum]PVZ95182.1 serine/threonine protein kinase [Amnibacterium flavum]